MRRLQVRCGPRLEMLIGTVGVQDEELERANKACEMRFILLDDHQQEAVRVVMPVRTYRPRGARHTITAGPVLDATDLTIDQLRLIPDFREDA